MRSSLERTIVNGLGLGIWRQSPQRRVYQNLVPSGYLIRHRIYEQEY